jgi:SAM-dependent methyltransferase
MRELLKEPMTRSLDVNASEMSIAHRQVLLKKHCLRRLFQGFYAQCHELDQQHFGTCEGMRVEIGSGSSIIKEFLPDVTTTDIKPLPFVDMVVDAQDMPFENNSVRALYGINVFHHLPQPRSFFKELNRVLQPGGGTGRALAFHSLA